MMDFAFVPLPEKKGDSIAAAKTYFGHRLGMSQLIPPAKANLQAILEHADSKTPASDQIGRLFLVSHASDHHVSFPMVRKKKKGGTVYTELVRLKTSSGFTAPARFTAPVPSGGTPIDIIIKGCRVGSSDIFMALLKDLLGGNVQLSAPRHYDGFLAFSKGPSSLVFETLTYNIEVHSKDELKTLSELVQAFKDKKFLRYDGSQIPDNEIDQALKQLATPRAVPVEEYLPTDKSDKQIKRPLRVKIKFNENVIGRTTHSDNRIAELRTECVRREVNAMNTATFNAKPLMDHVADAQAKWDQDFKNPIAGREKSFGEHLGLTPEEDLTTLIEWKGVPAIDPRTKAKGFRIIGRYFRYQLLLPITSIGDGSLLFDCEVLKGAPLSTLVTWPTDAAHQAALFRTI